MAINSTPEEAIALFEALENKFPHKSLGDDRWYLVAVSIPWKYFLPQFDQN